jgi:hypothetical protein
MQAVMQEIASIPSFTQVQYENLVMKFFQAENREHYSTLAVLKERL